MASKFPLIWECQLIKLLPNVKIIPTDTCIFSHEEQFKIIFKRINDELKPYIWQFNHNNETLNILRGPNGMNGAVDDAWRKYSNYVRTNNHHEFSHQYYDLNTNTVVSVYVEDVEIKATWNRYLKLNEYRIHLAGNKYDGTAETIDPVSQQGRLLKAKNTLVQNAFNHPDQYETIIRIAEIFKKVALMPQEEFSEESWCFVS